MRFGITKNKEPGTCFNGSRGFTLVELMIATGLFGLVIAGSLGVYIMCQRMWRSTSLSMDTSHMAGLAIQRMVYGVGTNSGLRAAAMVTLNTNVGGHPYNITNYYWQTDIAPPEPANSVHYVHVGCSYIPDGSWRLTYSNIFNGVMCLDYNIKQRNILFCPDLGQTTAARSKRILICNYVSSATVNNTNGTVEIQLTVWKKDGMFVSSNQASTFIRMRNNL